MLNENNIVGKNIKFLRESLRLNQIEFGKLFHATDKSVSTWENGTRSPRMDTALKIADYFKIDIDTFLKKDCSIINTKSKDDFVSLSEHEKDVIRAYRNNESVQYAVDKLLGLDKVKIYVAAQSDNDEPDRIIQVSRKELERIEQLPNTDEKL